MIKLGEVTLESEMDILLSSQKFSRITDLLHLSLSTRSTFASAISEVVRVMTDHTDNGLLAIGISEEGGRFKLICNVKYPSSENGIEPEQFHYARKLVPFFDTYLKDECFVVALSIGLPRSMNLDLVKIRMIATALQESGPVSAYELLKISKNELYQKTELQGEELKAAMVLNDLKSEFISMASHELKTPITILKAYGQLALSKKVQTLEEVQTIVMRMNSQSAKLSALALQLLDSAKIEIGNLEYEMMSVDLNSYLLKIIEDLKHLVPDHSVKTQLCNTCALTIDKLRIEQVVSNLISNAAKYSEKGTSIHIYTNIDLAKTNMILSISDEGIGISKAGMLKIFDKFYREPTVISKQSGLGMGMYIASKIVASHGGKIWVESDLGKGSTFYFSLPLI
ncbi:MAG: ATP-binding region ATPase domain protein [Pedobacter sp.]|nr:ATP-binding region ATPase domain protein [Pedobacter sp.]